MLPTIDPMALDNLRLLNPDDGDVFLREIIAIFLSDTPKRLEELEQSLAAADVAAFTRAAHSIKGSSSNLGANTLRSAAEKLEHSAKAEGLANIAGLLADVRREFGIAARELDKLLKPA
jgi:HPt (histidine-containing phosphotransfer) domain-containing protein